MIRVRFAPSPTGHLHIGGLRGALFNLIFARKHNGKFLLRVEDTDLERSKQEYTDGIIDAFRWCNITSDERVVFQSDRMDIYKKYIDKLLESKCGYWADEPDENGIVSTVLKCRVPHKTAISFPDIIRGKISFDTAELEDFIVVRSDGMPLYNFVVVVDDIEMNISHVIRGEEHLSNTPRQLILYEAFNATPPQFAHLPLILGKDGKKLSKRDAATAVIDYQKMGFLPEALCNYLMRLGWSHGDQEIFTYDELIKHFDLKDVHSAGAMFDMQKLLWMNGAYIKTYETQILFNMMRTSGIIDDEFCGSWDNERKLACIKLYQERSNMLVELAESCQALYVGAVNSYQLTEEYFAEVAPGIMFLEEIMNAFEVLVNDEASNVKEVFSALAKEHKIPISIFLKVIRFALTGQCSSPAIYAIAALLGKQEGNKRLKTFSVYLKIQKTGCGCGA